MNCAGHRTRLQWLAAMIVLFAPSWALAGEASCIWASISEAGKAKFLRAYEQGGSGAVADPSIDAGWGEQAARNCADIALLRRDTNTVAQAMAMALQGYAVEKGVERVIAARRGVPAAKLDLAWRSLTEAQRVALLRAAPPQNQIGKEALDAVEAAIRNTGWSGANSDWFDDPKSKEFAEYFLARATQESAERRF